jgi:hypothetical protein
MTGPEHYREAESLLAGRHFPADPDTGDSAYTYPPTAEDIAAAQVHATLALAAATALSEPTRSAPRATIPEWDAWHAAAGVKPPTGGAQ